MNKCFSVAASLVAPYANVTLFTDNLYTTQELHTWATINNQTTVGTVRYNNLPKSLKQFYKEFKKQPSIPESFGVYIEAPIIELPIKSYLVEGIYYLFVRDNGCFVMSTNSKELFDKGKKLVLSKANEDQRRKFYVFTYKINKIVPLMVALYNDKCSRSY